jgi:TolB-like protein/Tfp pilus assembly protein PilF
LPSHPVGYPTDSSDEYPRVSLLRELKRRNVFRVGIAYLVLAWLVMQVADVILNNIDAPGWVFQAILLLLGIGFLFALFFAWAFELTPEGLKREHEVDRETSITDKTGRKLDFAIIGILVVALAYFMFDKFAARPSQDRSPASTVAEAAPGTSPIDSEAAAKSEKSIAVLPFADMSPDKDQDFFSDGLSEELLNLLAKVPELKVAARTSSFQFKGATGDVADIARQLKVAHVLEGSVRSQGDRVRVTAQLIHAADGYHLWSETYDRTLDDIFAIQDEIAATVVEQLKIKLLGEAPKTRETDPQAYSHFLQGRYLINLSSEENWRQAKTEFEAALEIDPVYAAAWAGLAQTYWSLAGWGYMDLVEGVDLARSAVRKALELDPELAMGWVSLAVLRSSIDWDFAGAQEAIDRALQSEPGNGFVQTWAGNIAKFTGHFDTAIEHYNRAVDLDPMSTGTLSALAGTYERIGAIQMGMELSRRVVFLNPDHPSGFANLSLLLIWQGQAEQALTAAEQEKDPVWRDWGLVLAYHALGSEEKSKEALKRYIENNQDAWAYQVGELYAFRGESDLAFQWLERARQQRDPGFSWILSDTLMYRLHNDPRWEPLLEQVGLLDYWHAMPEKYKMPENLAQNASN